VLGETFGARPSEILNGELRDLLLDLVLYSHVAKKRLKNQKKQRCP